MRSLIVLIVLALFCGNAEAAGKKKRLAECAGGDQWALQCVSSPHVYRSALSTRGTKSGQLDIATAGIVVSLACELGVSMIPGLDVGGKIINAAVNGFAGGFAGGLCSGLLGNAFGLNRPRPPRVVYVNRHVVVDNPLPYESRGSAEHFFEQPVEASPPPPEVPMSGRDEPKAPAVQQKPLEPRIINPGAKTEEAYAPWFDRVAAPGIAATQLSLR